MTVESPVEGKVTVSSTATIGTTVGKVGLVDGPDVGTLVGCFVYQ